MDSKTLLKLMRKTGVDRMQVPRINDDPHPALIALADELEAHWKKTVTERDEYAESLREQVAALGKDAERLNWLDRNIDYNCGWKVGVAPVGLISVQGVAMTKTAIREAIDLAMNA